MEDIKSRSSILYMFHELISRLETKQLDPPDLGLLRKARKFVEEYSESPLTYGLPSWVPIEVCSKCGGELFVATLTGNKNVKLCPSPLTFQDTKNIFYLDSVYVEFDGMKVRAMPGKMGTRWILHDMVCNSRRESLQPFMRPLWDATFKEIDYSGSLAELRKVME